MKRAALGAVLLLAAALAGCSSEPSTASSSVNNTQPVQVNPGVTNNYVNGVFTSVTVCVPGSSTCQTIPDILVDSGSYGLRLEASALTLTLPRVTDLQGNDLGECETFEDAYTWGPVDAANVTLAGEFAGAVPVQVAGDSTFSGVPGACSSSGLPAQDTVSALGANGVLGVGVFTDDCGGACSTAGATPPPVYFDCPSSGCAATLVPEIDQVEDPVALFASDNNGVLLELPAVPPNGSATVNGNLVFGIGTQADNTPTGITVLTTNDYGQITASYNGAAYSAAVDSGSNAYFVLDAGTLGIPDCPSPNQAFYCPATTTTYQLKLQGQNGASETDSISIADATTLFSTGNAAFANLGGANSGFVDLGLPFFFGRPVYFAFYGYGTVAGTGPWVGF